MISLAYMFLFLSFKIYTYEKPLHVAVSSNFLNTFNFIVKEFRERSRCNIIVSTDATAVLYNKIIRGAPFDIFISADAKHPVLLERNFNKSYFYCYGKLALLYSRFKKVKNVLRLVSNVRYLAVANLSLSPYGYYSNEVFNNLNLGCKEFVYGLNITNVFNFVNTVHECVGFVALSQVITNKLCNNLFWIIPNYLYDKIEQRFIVLKKVDIDLCLLEFLNYFGSDDVKNIIVMYGYKVLREY